MYKKRRRRKSKLHPFRVFILTRWFARESSAKIAKKLHRSHGIVVSREAVRLFVKRCLAE